MRTLILIGVYILICNPTAIPVSAQQVGDTVVVDVSGGNIYSDHTALSDNFGRVEWKDELIVEKRVGRYLRIEHEGTTGWISRERIMSEEDYNAYRAKQRARRRAEAARRKAQREHEKYVRSLRKRGYTILVNGMDISQNSADGITLSFSFENASLNKTIKYIHPTALLFNPVGDITAGRNSGPLQGMRAVGPIEPGEDGSYEFDNVWYSSTGACVELLKLKVEYIEGGTDYYVGNDLEAIARKAGGVSLRGGCSYENQSQQ